MLTTHRSFYYPYTMDPYLFILCAYLIGSIPAGLVLSKIRGKDPRRAGSGNIGATNVLRTAGKTLGILTLLGDILKGLAPVLAAQQYGEPYVVVAATGLATFLGHLYPLYLGFKGGKGVSTAVGVYLAINWMAVIINGLIFVLVVFKWRYVSLGSLLGTGLIPLTLLLLGAPWAYVSLSLIIALFVWAKHKDNIRRLLSGKENKIRGEK